MHSFCWNFADLESFQSIATVRRLPYPLLPNLRVVWATSNNACICAYLVDKNSSYLYIFYNRKMKTYKNPLNHVLKQCAITGGEMMYNSDEVVKLSSRKCRLEFCLNQSSDKLCAFQKNHFPSLS